MVESIYGFLPEDYEEKVGFEGVFLLVLRRLLIYYLSKEEAYEYIEEFCFRYVLVRHIRVGADPVGFLYIFGWKDGDGHVR